MWLSRNKFKPTHLYLNTRECLLLPQVSKDSDGDVFRKVVFLTPRGHIFSEEWVREKWLHPIESIGQNSDLAQ